MSNAADRFRRLSARFQEIVDAVAEERWASPSPCAGWTAADVLAHVVDTERDFLERQEQTRSLVPIATGVTRDDWSALRAGLQQVLDTPALADHQYDGWFGPTTLGETVDGFYTMDILVHGWDIARAAGLAHLEPMPPEDVKHFHAAVASFGDALRSPGVCGPEVMVGPDASAQDRYLAFVGRHP